MINTIKSNNILCNYISDLCLENGVCATIDNNIPNSDYVIVKVDNYYNSLKLAFTPCGVDCPITLILSKSNNIEVYKHYLIELKNIRSASELYVENIYYKFYNTLNDFMDKKFSNIYNNKLYKIRDVKLLLITPCYRFFKNSAISDEEKKRKLEGTRLEQILSVGTYEYHGRLLQIEYELPNPLITK